MGVAKERAINFDLDTKKMRKVFSNDSEGYRKIQKTMKSLGFKHRQGSGYVSRQKMDAVEMFLALDRLAKENPWLENCARIIDVTDVRNQYDLTSLISEYSKKYKMASEETVAISANKETVRLFGRPSKKAINFDLDTQKMGKTFSRYTEGYGKIRQSMKKVGFNHRQGSGYISKIKMDTVDIFLIIDLLVKENLWLDGCVKKMDVTDVGRQYDVTKIVAEAAGKQKAISNINQNDGFEVENKKAKSDDLISTFVKGGSSLTQAAAQAPCKPKMTSDWAKFMQTGAAPVTTRDTGNSKQQTKQSENIME